MSSSLFESLEGRSLMSVNLAGVIGPLKIGSTYNYVIQDGTGKQIATQVDKVAGTTFAGTSVIAISSQITLTKTGSTSTHNQYLALTPQGVVTLGDRAITKYSTTTKIYSPTLIKIPTKAVAGHRYTFYSTAHITIVDSKGRKTSISDSFQDKILLINSKTFTLKVGGKKYQVFDVVDDETSASYGTTHVETWYSPGIGLIQQKSDVGTITLTGYTP